MTELIELNKIRNDFQNDLKEWFDIAHTFIEIAKLGVLNNMDIKSSSLVIPKYLNESLNFVTFNELSYEEMLVTYYDHKGAIAELIYERIIQRYYDFLSQIIEQIVKYNITGITSYKSIPKIEIKVDFSKSKDNFLEQFPVLIKDSFDFKKNIEKTKLIEECLEKKIDEELKQEIKKAIITRNLLEHSRGIIREQDIKTLGRNSIKLIDDHCIEKEFKLGEKVEITIYEIFRLNHILCSTSNILIP